jgi:hypothetical protein
LQLLIIGVHRKVTLAGCQVPLYTIRSEAGHVPKIFGAALQASATRRFSHGLQFLAAYAFSKSMGDTCGGSTTLFSTLVGNQADLGTNKARARRFMA